MTLTTELVIECTHEYHKSIDRLTKLVRITVERLEAELKRHKISARVSGRAKSQDSLQKKLENWAKSPSKSPLFNSKHDVFAHVGDLAAVRVMTYVEQDRERVTAIVREIFCSREGKADFEYEVKENSTRIKENDANYYRATHMQICLKAEDLHGEYSNLKEDHCELQITSMLAHVWNEIEHDISYKGDKSVLSAEERSALESLGLLTKTGDNIIASLIDANSRREETERRKFTRANSEIIDKDALSKCLQLYYGEGLFGRHIDYWRNNDALFQTLAHIRMTHPSEIFDYVTPALLWGILKNEIPEFKKYCIKKKHSKPAVAVDTCDLFLIAILKKYYTDITKIHHVGRGPKPRHISFAQRWQAFVSFRDKV